MRTSATLWGILTSEPGQLLKASRNSHHPRPRQRIGVEAGEAWPWRWGERVGGAGGPRTLGAGRTGVDAGDSSSPVLQRPPGPAL